jgi:hypothetical protein
MIEAAPVATRQPDEPVHRLGRTGSVWAWPDWAFAGEDGTFGNRFDDARGTFRVLYASSQRLGTFLETLARFRPDPHVLAAAIAADPRDGDYPTSPAGRIPAGWLAGRSVGRAVVDGDFVELGHSATLAYLRPVMAARLLHFGLDDLDAASIRIHAPRAFTQEVAAHLYEVADAAYERRFQGIAYRSRLGDEIDNWAIWEPADGLVVEGDEPIGPDDPDLLAALDRFRLTLAD